MRITDLGRDYGDYGTGRLQPEVTSLGKPVTVHELEQFVRSTASAGIPRAMLVVDSLSHVAIDVRAEVPRLESAYHVPVLVIESVTDFLRWCFSWSGRTVSEILARFPDLMYRRMLEIEAKETELLRWNDLFPDESSGEA